MRRGSPMLPLLTFFFFIAFCGSMEDSSEYCEAPLVGGISDCEGFENSLEIQDLGRFAVNEHNTKQNALLEFTRVVKAQQQIVEGVLYYLTLEAIDAGQKKIYDAQVWVRVWLNFKELTDFEPAAASSFTSAYLGLKKDVHKPGWQSVPTQDPQVQDAADYALKSIQQRSNSLVPYELHEVVDAKAEVIDDSAKFNLVLKVKRGEKEEKFKVKVHKNNEGGFHLNQLEQDNS
ncbi:hypothetical protein Lal_00034205 [Lupinus albus]|uniref:Cysteine proteinase inhibitor n=1 Tax=Lupinus albus TaxID=3870 RepID=A0A6A4QTI8_LUPAL|nr:putative Cystatin domain-containing protein [Lupinus albus]KAF1896507.1 hypothetical protein Lal_00034205 [Lupinus albus]